MYMYTCKSNLLSRAPPRGANGHFCAYPKTLNPELKPNFRPSTLNLNPKP